MKYVHEAGAQKFDSELFLSLFEEHGLRRSIDKAYEIVVYALFRSLLQAIGARVTISVDPTKMDVLKEFEDFTRLVLGIDSQILSREVTAQISRTGVANAADRGLDMWANFGPAVQVKHVSLSEEFAEEVAEEVRADEIIIVCRSAEREMVERICRQLGQRLRGIITESELISWYERALSPQRQDGLGTRLIENLKTELSVEFPFSESFQAFYEERGYDRIPQPEVDCPFWEEDTWTVE